jgi:uncharacterized membrane protein YgdD (TMEM256/DUF423 family)
MQRFFLLNGAVFAAVGVAAGAFGAHALKSRLGPDLLGVFEVGVRYQIIHALALLVLACLAAKVSGRLMMFAGGLFIAGIILFSGSLYLLSLTGQRWLGAITPLGGLAFLSGWSCLILAALKG